VAVNLKRFYLWFPTGLNCRPPNCLLNKAKTLLAMPRNLLPIFFFQEAFPIAIGNWQLAMHLPAAFMPL